MINRIAENYSALPSKAAVPAKRLAARLDNLSEIVEPLQNLVLKYPGPALASAFLVGVAIAWWIKRR